MSDFNIPREQLIAAIDLSCPGSSDAEKHALLDKVTANVERRRFSLDEMEKMDALVKAYNEDRITREQYDTGMRAAQSVSQDFTSRNMTIPHHGK